MPSCKTVQGEVVESITASEDKKLADAVALLTLMARVFHNQEAADAARRGIENNPRFSFLHALLVAPLVRLGHIEDAKAVARQVLKLQPNFTAGFIATEFSGVPPDRIAPFLAALRTAGLPE